MNWWILSGLCLQSLSGVLSWIAGWTISMMKEKNDPVARTRRQRYPGGVCGIALRSSEILGCLRWTHWLRRAVEGSPHSPRPRPGAENSAAPGQQWDRTKATTLGQGNRGRMFVVVDAAAAAAEMDLVAIWARMLRLDHDRQGPSSDWCFFRGERALRDMISY